jgi:hypothetical protein
MDLQGSLHTTDLPTLVRFLAAAETSGRLRIARGDHSGDLYLEDGRITAASFGEARGLSALDAIAVELHGGRFTYDRGLFPSERQLDLTPAALQARLGTLLDPATGPTSAPRLNGVAPAGAAAAARVLREQLRPLADEAPPATVAGPAPHRPLGPRPRRVIGGRAGLAGLATLVALGAVAGSVLWAGRFVGSAGSPLPSRSVPGIAPAAPAAGTAPGAALGTAPSVTPAATVPVVATSPAAPASAPSVPGTPSPDAGVAATAGGPASLVDRVAAAEAALRSGRIEVTIGITETTRSTATVLFDLGDAAGGTGAPRLRMTSTYTGPAGTQTTDHIVVGGRAWDRQPDGRWVGVPPAHGPWDQVAGLLPRARTATDPEVTTGPDGTVLRWYEAGFDADLTLRVDPATGVPREYRRAARATGIVVSVAYTGWNVPVDIAPPQT